MSGKTVELRKGMIQQLAQDEGAPPTLRPEDIQPNYDPVKLIQKAKNASERINAAQAIIDMEKEIVKTEVKELQKQIDEKNKLIGKSAQARTTSTPANNEPKPDSALGKYLALIEKAGKPVGADYLKSKVKKFNASYLSILKKKGLIISVARGLYEPLETP